MRELIRNIKGVGILVIYVDTLICVNIILDCLILYSIKRFLHINARSFRIILASLFAGVSTVIVFLPFYSVFISILARLMIGGITVIIAFSFNDIIKFIVRTLSYIGASMLLCGCVILIEVLWDPGGCAVYNDVIYFDISPTLLIITALFIYTVLGIYQRLRNRNKLSCAIKRVKIQIGSDSIITFESAIDTGCNLKEPFSGLPVIIVEKELIDINKLSEHKFRIIPFTTASGSDVIMGFKPEKVYIENKQLYGGCYIALCNNKLRGEIKSIMGNEIWEAI